MSDEPELRGTIQDASAHDGSRQVRVVLTQHTVEIYVYGYGNDCMEPGTSSVAALELWEGRLRLLTWPDMHDDAPQVVDLEGASESRSPAEDT